MKNCHTFGAACQQTYHLVRDELEKYECIGGPYPEKREWRLCGKRFLFIWCEFLDFWFGKFIFRAFPNYARWRSEQKRVKCEKDYQYFRYYCYEGGREAEKADRERRKVWVKLLTLSILGSWFSANFALVLGILLARATLGDLGSLTIMDVLSMLVPFRSEVWKLQLCFAGMFFPVCTSFVRDRQNGKI